jgi:16S rRNA processing protein RimM
MDNLVRLGVITRIFGLKGDVICSLDFKVIPEIVIPCKVNLGFTEGYSNEILLLSSKPHSAYLVMKFENINTPQAATELIEQALFIDRKYVVYSNPFITPDLINYKIKDNNNLVIGELKEIYSSSAHPVWLIVNDDKQELMIPAVKEFITDLNCSDKYATVKLIEGMAFE